MNANSKYAKQVDTFLSILWAAFVVLCTIYMVTQFGPWYLLGLSLILLFW